MKRLFYILVFSIFNFQLSISHAQLLYSISGNGAKAKSYLLATNELVDQDFLDTIPKTFACFGRSNKVITEFTMKDYEAIQALRTAALLPDSVKLENFFSATEYEDLSQAILIQTEIPLSQLARMKPSYLTALCRTELMKRWLGYDPERSIETFFAAVAEARGLPVIGLDDTGETLYMLFDREPFHWQCRDLKQVINYPEKEVQQAKTIKYLYLMGLLTEISYEICRPDNNCSISYSDYDVWAKRNITWAKRLNPYLKEGGCFITLHAEYLGGDKGLIAQLRSLGYKVKPIRHRK